MRWFVTEPKTYIKERRKPRQWMHPWTYYPIINCLRLTDKEDFKNKILKKALAAIPILLFCLNKNETYLFPIFFILQKWTLFIKKFSCFFLFLRHVIEWGLHKWGLIVFYSKNWFYFIHYTEIIFLSKNGSFFIF